jgi:hypothetical protein
LVDAENTHPVGVAETEPMMSYDSWPAICLGEECPACGGELEVQEMPCPTCCDRMTIKDCENERPEMRTDDNHVKLAFAVAKAAYDIDDERREYNDSLAALYEEVGRLRAALQAAKDLAIGDAPAHMIVDACDRVLNA